jgi:glycosyltransferase involved in cell wall biosynthesis
MHLLSTLAARGHRVVALYPETDLENGSLLIPGVEVLNFSLDPFAPNLLKDLRSLRSLRSRFASVRPTHVVSFTIKPVVYGGLAAASEGVPKIFSIITGLGYLFAGSTMKRSILRRYAEALYVRALAHNTRVFFQNLDDLDLFVERGLVSREQAALVRGSGVDISAFTPAESQSAVPTFAFIGRLLWDKGIGEFIEAARILKAISPAIRMIVAGPSSLNPASVPEGVVRGWEAEGLIEYRGHLQDVRPLIAESWAIVLPSYREGCSRLIQEALAMGRPVITSDAPGCRESITHGEHGLIVPTRDGAALMEAMLYLVRSPLLRKRMGELSRKRAVECFDQERITYDLVNLMGL